MKYIKKKIIKGQEYYYFVYYLGLKNQSTYSKYLGVNLPDNLKERMQQYFQEIASLVVPTIKTDYFHNVKVIEEARFQYILQNHELFINEKQLFKTLFYILFVLNSNRSEGSKVTQTDIEKVISRKIKPKTMIEKEIVNSIKAINFAFSDEMKWNAKSIKKIHHYLLHNLDDFAGQYKKVNNIVNNSTTTVWQKVPQEIKKLLIWFKKNKKMYPPQLALEFHWRFEAIHPFLDGNGRVGRILLNSFLVQQGYAPVIYFTDNHQAYCNSINKAQQGRSRQLAEHFVLSVKKSEKAIEQYKKSEIIQGGSTQVGKWEIQKGKIRLG
ncbi:MAG: Fic family protein [Nanoarchaeota archaeon]|nr:Fic family protein [Nanoarchaeota archaeon]MBU1622059.1 Fic family protein [Nanoarchaeota archaeon]MBU1974648.1 Fic family protein [Nanoarchaeota archaeon]